MEQRARFGMALFLLNQAVLFFMLIAALVYLRAPIRLTLSPAVVYSACLLASGVTVWRNWPGATLTLGAIFLYGEIAILRSQAGTAFFTLTAVHAAHVFIGLLLMSGVRFRVTQRAAVNAVALYWYFVIAVWIAIFAVAYFL
jgi:heme/copper-type cytochrome/quinol oxidase subunit 3